MPFALKKQNADLDMASPEALDGQVSGQLQNLTRGASSYEEGRRAVAPDRNQVQRAPVQMERKGAEPALEAVQEINLDAAAMRGGDAEAEQEGQRTSPTADEKAKKDTKKGAKNGDNLERAGAAATVICDNSMGIYSAATEAESAKTALARDNPASKALNEGVSQTSKDLSVWAAAGGAVFDVVGLVTSIIALNDKNTKNSAYAMHMRGGDKSKKGKPGSVADIARYAYFKSVRALFDAWYKILVTAMNLAGNVLTLLGAAAGGIGAALGLTIKAVASAAKLIRAAWRGGKALYKMILGKRGKNRQINAEKLIELAMKGDPEACEMLLEMEIGMLTGSVEHSIRRTKGMRKIGLGHEERLSDSDGKKLDAKTATPADVANLLRALNAKMNSSDKAESAAATKQYKGLRAELMQSMRSVI